MVGLTSKALLVTFVSSCLLALMISISSDSSICFASGEAKKPLVTVLVDSSIYAGIEGSLDQYAIDVAASGFSVNIVETNVLSENTPSGIRTYLQHSFHNDSLTGALMVGDVPEAWYKVQDREFPTDVYYMDLDGIWFDLDKDGIYDARGGDLPPEIWVGRLKVSTISGDQVSLINSYFRKNHRYRTGSLTLPWWRALVYMDDQTLYKEQETEAALSYVATEKVWVTDPYITNATDYRNRLKDAQGYQWLYLMSHGSFDKHTFHVPSKDQTGFEPGGTIYSSDYGEIDPRVFFYHFVSCSAARYVEQNYIAGSAVFTTTYGLLAFGGTDNMYTVSFTNFYRLLSEGETIGAAFKGWLEQAIQENEKDIPSGVCYQFVFNDITLIGDPTLYSHREVHDAAITDLSLYAGVLGNKETLLIVSTVENHGEFPEEITVNIFYDSERIFSAQLALDKGMNSTITFRCEDLSMLNVGTQNFHIVEARASMEHGEFDTADNYLMAHFCTKVIEAPPLFSLSPIVLPLLVDGGLAVLSLGVIRMLMSDRPFALIFLTKMRRFLQKEISKLKY
jgi:hypothetical protein